jgi:signal peptidase I
MEPFILKGDTFTIKRSSFSQVKPGDSLAFWNSESGSIMVHRCIKKLNNSLKAKGDNNLLPDDLLIKSDDVLGIVAV